ncbi:hypothetical protein RF11_11110 [Thelohanellus kitauei]|uniref:Uncharacterized protein n=1 Tax=Thelohanellus kitauei TaxID=669202 RepID=A0A0C2IVR6_THEKT|nr:hypothetical protein RF11_11110 [Thelohanellus kitauei]
MEKRPPINEDMIKIKKFDNLRSKEICIFSIIILRLVYDKETDRIQQPLFEINIKISKFSISENNDSTIVEINMIGWQINCPDSDQNYNTYYWFLIIDNDSNEVYKPAPVHFCTYFILTANATLSMYGRDVPQRGTLLRADRVVQESHLLSIHPLSSAH